METSAQTINLFQMNAGFSPVFSLISKYLRIISLVFVIVLIFVGAGIAFWFYSLNVTRQMTEQKKLALVKQIESNVAKEAMMKETKFRLSSIGKILSLQESFTPFLDTTIRIAQVPELTSFTLGDQNVVALSIKTKTLSRAIEISNAVFTLVSERKIFSPMLDSLTVESDGSVQMNISFKVILK